MQGDGGEDFTDTNSGSRNLSKTERVIDKYDLENCGDRLVAHWTGDGVEQRSTRELADWFNQKVLEAAIQRSDMAVLEGEVENLYRLLTDEDVSQGHQTQTELKLEQEGVDIDEVRNDFVSHQTIHTYLTDIRGVRRPSDTDDSPDIDSSREKVQRLIGRLHAVTEQTIDSLVNAEKLFVGDYTLNVSVRLYCDDCGRQFNVDDLLSNGGCECERPN